MQRNQTSTLAAVAVLMLSLFAGAATTTPVLATDESTDFVCYDMPNRNPDEGLVCMTVDDFKAECEEGSGLEECDLIEGETVVIGGIIVPPPAPAPLQSLVGDNAADEERSGPTRVRR